ncbi:FAD-binding oxidoreductase [Stagnihabitans tardus]|uniref:FAD-binding protein n=1 Tax=Stagnihabitans tardus TaxID=2699202 RepID=A0AAE4YBQ9_9RHOB|nr:FAD-binding oxidoreductase [Stagnihabitans tardus]NBZ89731.1 FAD-binding protein [Stagnihabitans tardus]
MTLIAALTEALGAENVVTGEALARYTHDWSGHYKPAPCAVARPGSTDEVAAVLRLAQAHGVPVIPVSGLTGIVGGAMTEGGLFLSVERMNRIRSIHPEARVAVVEAGVVLQNLHDAAEALGLYFPLWFGARGSAMIGGVLSTNAGGSNVLRYGSTRGLCLGLEVVLADGRILNLMSELHKNNSGYDLRQMFIGAEGTLGVITAATMRLVPKPRAYATAWAAVTDLPAALGLLNRLQEATGGLVEAFEFMPRSYMERLKAHRPDIRQPFATLHEVNILMEVASTAPRDCAVGEDGRVPLQALLEDTLAAMMEAGTVLDAEIAASDAQRLAMWKRRELAAEVMNSRQPTIDTDISLPLQSVAEFFTRIEARLPALDPGFETITVAHLGDGNLHFTVYPSREGLYDAVIEAVEDVVQDLGGSFSAEHGVGLSKLASMKRRKDPVALEIMRAVKQALDPKGLMNPGKVIPA